MTIGAVVLAAGAGQRFGGGKLTALWRGQPLIVWAAQAALASCEGPVVTVLGTFAPEVAAVLPSDGRLSTLIAEDHALGMAHSLKAGLSALPEGLDGVFVFLGDMPRVPASLAAVLIAALAGGALAAAPMCDGQRGHPVLIAARLLPQLLALTGDRGAGALLSGLGDDLALIETDNRGVLFDVDTRADLGDGGAV